MVFGRTNNKEWKSNNMIEDIIGKPETEITRDKYRRYIVNQIINQNEKSTNIWNNKNNTIIQNWAMGFSKKR